jgi:hypothetical protein
MGHFEHGFDKPYAAMFLLTIMTENINDWINTKKASRQQRL